MLTNSLMGVLALGILWINDLLVALAAYQRLRALSVRNARLRPIGSVEVGQVGLLRGKLRSDEGERNVARTLVEQHGRYGTGAARSILWHDRRYGSESLGGSIVVDGKSLRIEADARAEVWPELDALEKASVCPSATAFDEAFTHARKAKGFVRTVETTLGDGDEVWVYGEIAKSSAGLCVRANADAPLLISAIDPGAWCRRQVLYLGGLVIPLVVGAAAVCTVLALTRPFFGPVSMVGGGLGFLYFLLVLPAGTAARDAVREPHRRILRGKWEDPAPLRKTAARETSTV